MYICRQADISRPTLSTRHWQKNLLNLNAELAEVLLIPHVLVSVPGLVEGEDLLVDDGLDVVGFDGAVHFFELKPAADQDAADGADVVLRLDDQSSVHSFFGGRWRREERCCGLPGNPGK